MKRILEGLEPQKCFQYFEEVSRIPRSSHKEQEISDYLVRFAKERNLNVTQDDALNILISKPATLGYENRKKVMLQGHMDMVCVKDEGIEHDFDKDPIPLYIDGDYIKAKGTTLGADNGTALALILALLDSNDIPHPDIQAIFTTAEEVGLVGANKLHPEDLEGDYLINLDAVDSSEMLLSCAGVSTHIFHIDTNRVPVDTELNQAALHIHIGGMTSGHSGMLAHLELGNAIKIMGNMLSSLKEKVEYQLLYFHGGAKMNAIAKECVAAICFPEKSKEMILDKIRLLQTCITREYQTANPDLFLEYQNISLPITSFSPKAGEKLIDFVDLLHDGTYKFMDQEKTMAKTSCNIGILEEKEHEMVFTCLMRSNSDFEHEELIRKMKKLTKIMNVTHKIYDESPAWEFHPEGNLVKIVTDLYRKENDKELVLSVAHFSIEPGIIIALGKKAGKEIQAINFGVEGSGAHTTKENLYIPSMEKTYNWLKTILKNLD